METERWAREQAALLERVERKHPDGRRFPAPGHLIATLDVQYIDEAAFVAIDLLEWPDRPLQTLVSRERVTERYQPGYFAFREGPVLVAALRKLVEAGPAPDLLIVDGHGRAHPRHMGVATWLGVALDRPALGLAKESLLPFGGTLPDVQGATLDIRYGGDRVGVALRTVAGVKPVFVSEGHRLGLDRAVEIVLELAGEYRVIEPMRRADQACRAAATKRDGHLFTWLDL